MSYGKKFKEVRRAHLLSQEQFAKKLGISRSVVSQIEIDKIQPTIQALRKLASTFNISLDYLMRD
ncbi:MAG: helix-turn-helix domain-containing protein, partial [Chitinophagales bacterium]